MSEPETLPEPEPETVQEIEPELPDIPVIEADFDPVPDNIQDTAELTGGLPDIPLIVPDGDDEDDIIDVTGEDLAQEDNPQPHDPLPQETPDEEHPEFQEAELVEAPEIEDDFADLSDDDTEELPEEIETEEDFPDDFTDEPIDEEPALSYEENTDDDEPPTYDIEADEAGLFADDEQEQDDTASPADVVLNIDDELPQISSQEEPELDPEAEPAPVTVTMPESTKTAEDKLMADIAEAMTGNPLSLDSHEQPGSYAIPENFFTPDSGQTASPQSAEDKLKANIAQALSESPIDTAQNQARQDLEQDISPFDELSAPEPGFIQEDEQQDDDFFADDADTETLTHDSPDDESLPDFDTAPETEEEPDEPMNIDDADDDPFAVPDFADDDTQPGEDTLPEAEIVQEPETFPEFEPDSEPEPEPIPEPETEPEAAPETDDTPDSFTGTEDDMPFALDEPASEPEPEDILIPQELHPTEQDSLAREVAAMTQELDPEDTPGTDTDTTHEEAAQEDNMPEQSLLDDDAQEGFTTNDNDDWDMSSLGELGAAATLPDDEPEDFSSVPGTVTEMITEPTAGIIHNPDDEHKETEKTVNIREKLASRKDGASDSAPAGKKKSGGGGILMPILLGLLIVIGGLILWQIMTLSDKLTSLAMSSPSYESVSGNEAAPSYAYAIDFILDPNLADRMAQRGREGWQVVGSRRTQDSTTGQYGYEFIFMRRIPGR